MTDLAVENKMLRVALRKIWLKARIGTCWDTLSGAQLMHKNIRDLAAAALDHKEPAGD